MLRAKTAGCVLRITLDRVVRWTASRELLKEQKQACFCARVHAAVIYKGQRHGCYLQFHDVLNVDALCSKASVHVEARRDLRIDLTIEST